MLLTLESGGYINLVPAPPTPPDGESSPADLYEQIQSLDDDGTFGEQTVWDGRNHAVPDVERPGDDAEELAIEEQNEFGVGVDNDEDPPSDQASGGRESPDIDDEDVGRGADAPRSPEVVLDSPPVEDMPEQEIVQSSDGAPKAPAPAPAPASAKLSSSLKFLLEAQGVKTGPGATGDGRKLVRDGEADEFVYAPDRAYPNESLADVLTFRSVNPLYGLFLLRVLPHADGAERMRALESVLTFPGSLCKPLRIPR